jgi:MFS family permease
LLAHASRLAPLLASIAILLIGHGLQLSFLPLRAADLGWSGAQIGLSSSFYFGGLLLGCYSVPLLVRTVGHIRVFTVLTAIMTAALLSISLLDGVGTWLVLRLVIGWEDSRSLSWPRYSWSSQPYRSV